MNLLGIFQETTVSNYLISIGARVCALTWNRAAGSRNKPRPDVTRCRNNDTNILRAEMQRLADRIRFSLLRFVLYPDRRSLEENVSLPFVGYRERGQKRGAIDPLIESIQI